MNAWGSAVIMWRTTVRPSAWSVLMASPRSTRVVSRTGPHSPVGQHRGGSKISTSRAIRPVTGSIMGCNLVWANGGGWDRSGGGHDPIEDRVRIEFDRWGRGPAAGEQANALEHEPDERRLEDRAAHPARTANGLGDEIDIGRLPAGSLVMHGQGPGRAVQ